jgi:DNA-binding MarR family transcriptional regulator
MKILEAITLLKNSCILNDERFRDEIKLSPAEFNGIISLEKGEKITCQSLSGKMGLSVSRGSRVINKLLIKGYFKEEKLKNDKRCSIISLTREGIKAKQKIHEIIENCENKITSKLSAREIEETRKCLVRLIKLMQG